MHHCWCTTHTRARTHTHTHNGCETNRHGRQSTALLAKRISSGQEREVEAVVEKPCVCVCVCACVCVLRIVVCDHCDVWCILWGNTWHFVLGLVLRIVLCIAVNTASLFGEGGGGTVWCVEGIVCPNTLCTV